MGWLYGVGVFGLIYNVLTLSQPSTADSFLIIMTGIKHTTLRYLLGVALVFINHFYWYSTQFEYFHFLQQSTLGPRAVIKMGCYVEKNIRYLYR